jgi:hypothetical protein
MESKRPLLAELAAVLLLAGCGSIAGPGQSLTMDVAEARVPCVGVMPMECLLVRILPEQEYGMFYADIEGFDFEPGYRYRIRVSRRTVRNPPADGSSHEYRLRSIESKEPSPRRALLQQMDEAEAYWNEVRPVAYSMVLERVCFCAGDARGPVRIVVDRRDHAWISPYERVVQRRYTADERAVPVGYWHLFPSVQGLFGYVRLAVATDAHVIDVDIDEAAGYPRRIFIDQRPGVADDEFEYVVRSLDGS